MTPSITHHEYWSAFYSGRARNEVPQEPSPFAQWVRPQLTDSHRLVEFGFGTGRDALWFAKTGLSVTGYDFAQCAVDSATATSHEATLSAEFKLLNLYDEASVQSVAEDLAGMDGPTVIYGRFLLHSLEAVGRRNFLALLAHSLQDGGRLFLEFRTRDDVGTPHAFGDDHFRCYLDPLDVARDVMNAGGQITYQASGRGMAVHRSEDPYVSRVVAQW